MISLSFQTSVQYMRGCIMAKGSWKLALSITVAYKGNLMNQTKVFYYFFKDSSGHSKESGANGKSM